ncbi:MAG: hypothetical protein JNM20_04325 [Rhizobiales bacterium]|nr:hypothetical protein [Hyphomicrobiales bacterium]
MLHVDLPSLAELKALISTRADACLSIYVQTTPQTQHVAQSRVQYGNLVRDGLKLMEEAGIDKRRRALLETECAALGADDEFWKYQAHSLAVLATPDNLKSFRLATSVKDTVQVADRFLLKPLLRAIAFPQTAYILALSENAVRLIKIFPDLPPTEVKVAGLPQSAADAAGRASINNLTQNTRLANAEGQTVLLRQYARQVDSALRPVLSGQDLPLILAATQPLDAIFRNLNSYPALLKPAIVASPDRMNESELAGAARPILDQYYREEAAAALGQFEARLGERRATSDLAEIARAATAGAVSLLMVDIDKTIEGRVSDADGALSLAGKPAPMDYDIIDEIAGRAILHGAKFLALRAPDLPGNSSLAAILRYPLPS